jgi:hypothetical protein
VETQGLPEKPPNQQRLRLPSPHGPDGSVDPHAPDLSTVHCTRCPLQKDDREILEASYHLYLIDGADGTTDSIHRGTHQFGGEGYYSRPGINDEAVVSYDRVQKALQADGSLMVAADVEFLAPNDDGSSGKAIDECALHADEVHKRWAAKFSEFYGDDASYDCTIQVGPHSLQQLAAAVHVRLQVAVFQIGGETIPAHKLPLMANSPVFRVMFTSPVAEECKSGVVKITDFKEVEPMRAVIKFCYQGRLDAETMDGEGAVETFKLADRYCIADLKALFEKHFIAKTLSVENVVAMAVIADTYSAKELREVGPSILTHHT